MSASGPWTEGPVNSAPVKGNEYLDDGLETQATYWYRITAVAANGAESVMTDPVSALVGATKIFMTDLRGDRGTSQSRPEPPRRHTLEGSRAFRDVN